jgi:aspartyl/glutamyl-tRNA(Asn/Gln) amidotransferase C subunit
VKLTSEDVVHLARQARFSLSPDEVEQFRAQLNAVLQQVDVLNELGLGTDTIEARDRDVAVRLRADDIQPDQLEISIEKLTTDVVAGFFTVPRILGETGRTQ